MPFRFSSRPGRAFGHISGFCAIATMATLMFGTKGFMVHGSCMEPNLQSGERVLASRLPYWLSDPRRGDVVIFRYPMDPSKNYVKRVVGLPGDTVEISRGVVYVNNEPLREPYKRFEAHGSYGPSVVKRNMLFVLGDNRDQSNDSRFWGELPMSNVYAKAVVLYWPLERLHVIR